jgi:hypothetical protein
VVPDALATLNQKRTFRREGDLLMERHHVITIGPKKIAVGERIAAGG